MGYYRFMKKEK